MLATASRPKRAIWTRPLGVETRLVERGLDPIGSLSRIEADAAVTLALGGGEARVPTLGLAQLGGNLLWLGAHFLDADDLRARSLEPEREALFRTGSQAVDVQERIRIGTSQRRTDIDSGLARQVRIPLESLLVAFEQASRLFEADVVAPQRAFDDLTHLFDQGSALVLHVGEDVFHGVALDDVIDRVTALVVELDVNGIGVSKQVVEVTQDLLIRTDQEHADVIGCARPGVELDQLLCFTGIDEPIDLPSLSQVKSTKTPRRVGCSSRRWMGITGKSCLTAQ